MEATRVVSVAPSPGDAIHLKGVRAIVNPGAVGQPRDGDPRAAWATWDTEQSRFVLRRVDYPIGESQRAILDAGLPSFLARRLALGQ
jgi:diadenosine tetraphosphatase ApaH/serine/threonine PP2A family protein phosphatase